VLETTTCYGDAKIEINVDEIPPEVFATLNTYVTAKVKQLKATGVGGFDNNNNDSSSSNKMETISNSSSRGSTARPKKKQKK
jgi:hypothetical protein